MYWLPSTPRLWGRFMENNMMNWGKGIVIGMTCFVAFIVSLGVFMFMQPDDYDQQYYEKGLAYDKDYGKEKQVITDHAQPLINLQDTALTITFHQPAHGQINFVRPSDRHLDKIINLETGMLNKSLIPISRLATGQWQLELSWTSDGKAYLYKQEIYIP